MTSPLRLLLVDDHAVLRDGLASVLAQRFPTAVIEGVASAAEAHALLQIMVPDICLLDLELAGDSALKWLPEWRHRWPQLPVVILSANGDPATIKTCMTMGVRGYISKTVSAGLLTQAVNLVLQGGVFFPPEAALAPRTHRPTALSARQLEVLQLLAAGCPNKDICRRLQLAEGTVRTHVNAIFRALEASNRTQAVMRARAQGWI
jgi:DNA-binding NarL/FixJ family response regulator